MLTIWMVGDNGHCGVDLPGVLAGAGANGEEAWLE